MKGRVQLIGKFARSRVERASSGALWSRSDGGRGDGSTYSNGLEPTHWSSDVCKTTGMTTSALPSLESKAYRGVGVRHVARAHHGCRPRTTRSTRSTRSTKPVGVIMGKAAGISTLAYTSVQKRKTRLAAGSLLGEARYHSAISSDVRKATIFTMCTIALLEGKTGLP